MLSTLFFHPSLWSNTIMRKAYVIRPAGTEKTAIRVKLTAYRPARPVTLARFRGIPALALVQEFERDRGALQL